MKVFRQVCFAALLVAMGSPAWAATPCNGVINITVFDDVIVSNGASCTVDGATIVGSVTLEPGNGTTVFSMESGVITGSFVATGVNNGFVSIGGGVVLGDVEVGGQGMVGGVGARVGGRHTVVGDITVWHITGTIGGDVVVRGVRLQDNANSLGVVGVQLANATVYGSVYMQSNTVTPRQPTQVAFLGLFPIGVHGSRIAGSLSVYGNVVPDLRVILGSGQSAHPIVMGSNIIGGSADCRRNQPTVYREPSLFSQSIIVGKNVSSLCQ